MVACTNGWISFNISSSSSTSGSIPSTTAPNDIIAMVWDDLNVTGTGAIVQYWTSGSAPNRVFVIEYDNVKFYNSASNNGNISGQIRLFEADNHIEIHIKDATDPVASSKTLGIENSAGTDGAAPSTRNNVTWSVSPASPKAWSFSPFTPAYTYSWSAPTAPTTISSTSVSNPKIDNFGGTETYTVTVTETTSGCAVTANATVTLSSTPLALTTLTNSKPSYCIGDSSTLTVAVTGGCTPYTYAWSGGIATTAAVKVKPTTTTSYSVTVTDKNGATVTATTVTVNSLPLAAISPTTAVVCGATPATLTASGGTTYKWSVTSSSAVTGLYTTSAASTAYTAAADQNPMYAKPTATTSYTVTVTDANSCSATANTTVNVYSALTATATADPTTACSGDTSELNVTPAMSLGYSTSSIAYAPIATSWNWCHYIM